MTGKPRVGRVMVHYKAIDADPSDADNNVAMVAGDDATLLERALEAADGMRAITFCRQAMSGKVWDAPQPSCKCAACESSRAYDLARKDVPNE